MSQTLRIDPTSAVVYPEGWQSWTPTTTYPATGTPHSPIDEGHRVVGYRAESASWDGFVGEGLLAVRPAAGEEVHVFATDSPARIPSIRARVDGHVLRIDATGPCAELTSGSDDIHTALAAWAVEFDAPHLATPPRPSPRVWCSWYHYYTDVTQADIDENLAAITGHNLAVDVVQIDDGYQREIGDWHEPSDRFTSLAQLVERIRSAGRRAGIWIAPFLAGERSRLAAEHPDWLVPGADAGWNWGQRLYALDLARPAVQDHLHRIFSAVAALGIDYVKLDFLYAGALRGSSRSEDQAIAAYRGGLGLIREAVGDDCYLLGCGAPILASVGLVDAMRVSPDTAPCVLPGSGDWSSPGQRNAMLTGRARQWQNGIFWTNDPDCLLARPEVEQRETWATYVTGVDGLRSISDRIASLDEWGLRTTREYLDAGLPATPS